MGGTEEVRAGGSRGGRDGPGAGLAELARAGRAAMGDPDYAAALGSARWSAGPLARRPGRRGMALAAAAVLALSFALGLGSGAFLAAGGRPPAAAASPSRDAPGVAGPASAALEEELRAELALFAAELSGARGAAAYEAAYFPED